MRRGWGFSAALPGRVISGAGGPARFPRGGGGAGARVRVGFDGLRGACARRGHSGDGVALQMRLSSESVGGVFGTACGVVGAVGRARRRPGGGRRLFGAVGCPKVFYVVSLSSRPVAVVSRPDRAVVRARRAFRASRGLALAFAIFALCTLALALGCALPLDLDLDRLQRLRHHKEPLLAKTLTRSQQRARHPHLFATEHCKTMMARSLLLFACSAVALLPSRQQHKRSVMRMGWGDPPVCEPRPRSDFCARCTPSPLKSSMA